MKTRGEKKTDKEALEEALTRGVSTILPSKEKLAERMFRGGRLRLYLGIDPTGPHLHFGHATNLLTLKRLQELGHEVILLVGDFTARIGDPTDKLAARTALSAAEVRANMKGFKKQIASILRLSGKNAAKIAYNSKWFEKMRLEDVMALLSKTTVQQMMERDMFQDRVRQDKPIGVHEFLYPLMQGYDSVMLDVDLEVGGNDQTFNMLMGRHLQRIYHSKEKFVLATTLLLNPKTGKKLMNKSEGGMINLDDAPEDIFGKVMALDDASMFVFAELSTEMPLSRIEELRRGIHPRDAKLEIASAATALVYGEKKSREAKEKFLAVFSKKDLSGEFPEIKTPFPASLSGLVMNSGVKSKSEAWRLIMQGAVSINDEAKKDPREMLTRIKTGDVVKIGKHKFFRISIKQP
ncbi:MAG: tyrosine--tRNA ligase [Patescibacteria group bacterium]